MRSWQRIVVGVLLVTAVAVAGIVANFALLRLTQQSNDPVGKLSPRVVFPQVRPQPISPPPIPLPTTTVTGETSFDSDD